MILDIIGACLSGGIGRRTGLKILRELNHVPVQVRPEAPLSNYPNTIYVRLLVTLSQ